MPGPPTPNCTKLTIRPMLPLPCSTRCLKQRDLQRTVRIDQAITRRRTSLRIKRFTETAWIGCHERAGGRITGPHGYKIIFQRGVSLSTALIEFVMTYLPIDALIVSQKSIHESNTGSFDAIGVLLLPGAFWQANEHRQPRLRATITEILAGQTSVNDLLAGFGARSMPLIDWLSGRSRLNAIAKLPQSD